MPSTNVSCKKLGVISLGPRDISQDHRNKTRFMHLYYSHSRLLQEAWESQHFFIYHHGLSCCRTPSYSYCLNECVYSWRFCWASSRTVGRRRVTTGGCRGRCSPPARLHSWHRDPWLERNHCSRAAMAAAAAPPVMPHAAAAAAAAPPAVPPAAAATIAPPQIDLSDSDSNSDSYSSADDDSGSCVIVVGGK